MSFNEHLEPYNNIFRHNMNQNNENTTPDGILSYYSQIVTAIIYMLSQHRNAIQDFIFEMVEEYQMQYIKV
jgi:hypothetical protein